MLLLYRRPVNAISQKTRIHPGILASPDPAEYSIEQETQLTNPPLMQKRDRIRNLSQIRPHIPCRQSLGISLDEIEEVCWWGRETWRR